MKSLHYRYGIISPIIVLLALFLSGPPSYALEVRRETAFSRLPVIQVERHNLPVVMATLLIKASPLNEPLGKAGVAYLTSKLLEEGTQKRNSSQISEEIEFLGASIGASVNSDFTTLSLSVLKKDVDKGFDLFADVLLNPAFSDKELARKKELIKGTLRQREEDPAFVADKTFIHEIFGSHPYGRLVEGSVEGMDRIAREDVLGFYQQYYLPENAFLVVVGDLTPHELDALVERYLSGWGSRNPHRQSPDASGNSSSEVAVPAGRKVVVLDKEVTQASIMLGNLGIARSNPDYYAASVMNYILGGGGFASRLMKSVRDEMGLAYSISSSVVGSKEPGQIAVDVQTKNESAGVVIGEILKEIRRIRTEPVTDQELSDAKAYLTGSFPRKLETSRKIADFLTAVQFYGLGDDYIEKYPEYIKKVTKEDVLRAAKKYLDPEDYTLIVVGDKKKLGLDSASR